MPSRPIRTRSAVLGLLTSLALLSCGREVTGPGAPGRIAQVAFEPVFPTVRLHGSGEVLSIADVVPFTRVRVLLLRANGDTAVDRVVEFPPDSQSVSLTVNVVLSSAATTEGEPFSAALKYISASGDTVFSGGPVTVLARPTGTPPVPPQIPVSYTGAGANAASIAISPTSHTGTIGTGVTFGAVVRDAQGSVLTLAPVAFTSTDSARVRVNLRTGVTQLVGARGSVRVIAQTLTGQADTADVTITPTAAAILVASGGGQVTRQAEPFPSPVRVRVNAADGLGVAGVAVTFAVTRGQGAVTPTAAVTDASGFAETNWTAGDSAGVGQLTATVDGTGLAVTVSGTQLSSAPAALTFESQPPNFTAGDTLAPLTVVVRDVTADTVAGFNGNVVLDLTGGAASAQLFGVTTRAAVNGVATFPNLTIDRAGTGFRVRATTAGVPPATTNPFNVAAAPPRAVTVVGGNGQTAPPQTELPDTIRVRVSDGFGYAVPGRTVSFAVTAGGGSVAPASAVTDTAGLVRTRWTIGPSGAQQMTATVAGLTAATVNATVFVGGGSPVLFAGVATASLTLGGSRAIPVFVNPAAVTPIVATLAVRDTLVARWAVDSVVFTSGATLRSPLLQGVAQGSTWAVITSAAGTDSVLVDVQPAALRFQTVYSAGGLPNDTLRTSVQLSAPAPAGGVTVAVVSLDTSIALVAPSEGNGEPEDRCDDYYCSDLRAPGASGAGGTKTLLAPPAETAFVAIPEGRTLGHFAMLTRAPGSVEVRATAPNYALAQRSLNVLTPRLAVYAGTYGGITFTGQPAEFQVQLPAPLRRDLPVQVVSRDTMVVRPDTLVVFPAHETWVDRRPMVPVAPGTTWIVAQAPGFAPESTLVQVLPPYLRLAVRFPSAAPGSAVELEYSVTDSTGGYYGYWPLAGNLPVTVSSSDTSVLRPDFGGVIAAGQYVGHALLRTLSAGTAWVRVAAPGYGTDSVQFTVARTPLTLFDNSGRVGVGQEHDTYSVYLPGGAVGSSGGAVTYEVASSDPSIATVLTPIVSSPNYGYLYAPRILGRAPGTVTLTWTGANFDTTTSTLTVVPPELLLQSFRFATTLEADSARYGISVYTGHDNSVVRSEADSVIGVLRSTNPAVVLVTDSVVRVARGGYSSFTAAVRMLAPGTARLIVDAPGHTPDTSAVITLRPYRLDVTATLVSTGVGLQYPISVARRSPPGAALPLTATVSGPAGLTVREASPAFAAGASLTQITMQARAGTGTDTVILAAAGLAPDTVRFAVGASRIAPSASGIGLVGEELVVSARLRPAATFFQLAPTDSVRLVVRNRDSTLFAVVSDTIVFAPGVVAPTLNGAVRGLRPGTGTIVLEDPAGRFLADSLALTVVRQQLLLPRDGIELGIGQSTYFNELFFYRPEATNDSLWVRLTSSAPDVVRPAQDSVLLGAGEFYGYFGLVAGDSVGGAIITGSAPGYLDFALQVRVALLKLEPVTSYDLVAGDSAAVDVYAFSAGSFETRPLGVDLPFRLVSEDTALFRVGRDSTGTIPAGTGGISAVGPLLGVTTGRGRLLARDTRTGAFGAALEGWTEVLVRAQRLFANARTVSVAPGTTTSSAVLLDFISPTSRWVRATSTSGRSRVAGDSVLIDAFNSSASLLVTGLSAGIDTLVLSATGMAPDSIIVRVEDGVLPTSSIPAMLWQGDSIAVAVYLQTAEFASLSVAATPIVVTVASSGGLQAVDLAGAPLSTHPVASGAGNFTFRIRATGAGGGEITLSAPGFRTTRIRIHTQGAGQ